MVHKGTELSTVQRGYRKGFAPIGQWGGSYGDHMMRTPISTLEAGLKRSPQLSPPVAVLHLITRNQSCYFTFGIFNLSVSVRDWRQDSKALIFFYCFWYILADKVAFLRVLGVLVESMPSS